MTESVRHQGTEPPSPYQPMPSQEDPLGEWNEPPPAERRPPVPDAGDDGAGSDNSAVPDRPLPPQD